MVTSQIKFNRVRAAKLTLSLMFIAAFTSCDKSADSFSLASEEKSFQQTAEYKPRPIDILWVIDNSGSMATSQTNLANNFAAFISRFNTKGYDFHMGVTTTDAFYSDFGYTSAYSRLRDGVGATRSGVYVMDPSTPDLENVFKKNVKMGTAGSGDERALSSMKATLLNTWDANVSFRRPEAFLAVIIVSDEEDFSQSVVDFNESYSNPDLLSVASYKTWLDQYTGQIDNGIKKYSVNAITIKDDACKNSLTDGFSGRKTAQRVIELANLTGGISESLCTNFADSLDLISGSVVTLSTSFVIEREAIPESILIKVNGVELIYNTDFFYDASTRTVSFSETAAPSEGSEVYVFYDPVTIKQ
jgi:hypothetical protein